MERNPHKDALNDNKLSKTLFELVILYNFCCGFCFKAIKKIQQPEKYKMKKKLSSPFDQNPPEKLFYLLIHW